MDDDNNAALTVAAGTPLPPPTQQPANGDGPPPAAQAALLVAGASSFVGTTEIKGATSIEGQTRVAGPFGVRGRVDVDGSVSIVGATSITSPEWETVALTVSQALPVPLASGFRPPPKREPANALVVEGTHFAAGNVKVRKPTPQAVVGQARVCSSPRALACAHLAGVLTPPAAPVSSIPAPCSWASSSRLPPFSSPAPPMWQAAPPPPTCSCPRTATVSPVWVLLAQGRVSQGRGRTLQISGISLHGKKGQAQEGCARSPSVTIHLLPLPPPDACRSQRQPVGAQGRLRKGVQEVAEEPPPLSPTVERRATAYLCNALISQHPRATEPPPVPRRRRTCRLRGLGL